MNEEVRQAVTDAGEGTTGSAAGKGLCDLLIEAGKLSLDNVRHALRLQTGQESHEPIGAILVKLGFVTERDVAQCLAQQLELPLIEMKEFPDEIPRDERISPRFMQENKTLLLAEEDDQLTIVMADPLNRYVIDALRLLTGKQVTLCIGIASDIEQALEQYSQASQDNDSSTDARDDSASYIGDVEHLKELASEAPVIKLVNLIINRAAESGASDIHIEPFEHQLKVRYRIDGLLREADTPPTGSTAAVVSRVKIMANMNIAERRLPQDGRFKVRARGNVIDLRVSTVPTLHGESVVLRLLQRNDVALNFGPLGFSEELEQRMYRILAMPHGILLVTGPTGSGKTTTLYAALKHLNTPERKILTVEDPVEYNIEGVNQIQTKPQIGLTFANALRSIVRQDPDVIMIGEMRDEETAKIAVESALTGHLVLSTLHTNNAAGSITRLLDMGVEEYLLTSTVNAVMAQRLVRTLCPHCREAYTPRPDVVERWRLRQLADSSDITLYRATGCDHCSGTGYAGRSAIIELLEMTDTLRQMIFDHADAGMIMKAAMETGMRSMFDDGLLKAIAGVTSIEEVLRVTKDSSE